MKGFKFFIIFFLIQKILCAQETLTFAKNEFSVQGSSFYYVNNWLTINYSRIFVQLDMWRFYTNIGSGVAYTPIDGETFIVTTGRIGFLIGKKNNHFDANVGAAFLALKESVFHFLLPLVNIGYRYQRPEGGIIFKSYIGTEGLGLGLGYAF
ncbi:MAG: hypothetical protein IT235_08495 [Bacteroidia bacterium]|nr:hypothetical protein [Bacteroidia bacterium]